MAVPHKTAICKKHGETEYFWHSQPKKGGANGSWECVECGRERTRAYYKKHPGRSTEYYHRIGKSRAMSEAKDCSNYLGIVVAERVLVGFFDHIQRMPNNNPGYDYICGKGFKIDVKSSCLNTDAGHRVQRWVFHTCKNEIADYFLCLAFDDRENLEPKHVWLVPSSDVHEQFKFSVMNNERGIAKWSQHERSLDRVIACCDKIKVVV
jgi:hypothetical protein